MIRSVENSYVYKAARSSQSNGQNQTIENAVNGFPSGLAGQEKEKEERIFGKNSVTSSEVYAHQKTTTANPVHAAGQIDAGRGVETAVRNVKAQDCDYVVADILSGCLMKAQVDISGRSVYVELKFEDGEKAAYTFDPFHIPAGTDNAIEKMARESYYRALAQRGDEVKEQDTEAADSAEAEEAAGSGTGVYGVPGEEKAARYAYHPKYIGEMTNEEWNELLRKTDQAIEEGKQLSEQHKEEMEELAEQKAISRRSHLANMLYGGKYVPYSWMADENGIIEYNGVRFHCDYENGALCLGDMSNKKNVISIPLSGGGVLRVNKNNIDSLAKAIGMFSPEDVNRILRAIAQFNKVQQVEHELDEEGDSVGKATEEHMDQQAGAGSAQENREENQTGSAEMEQTDVYTGEGKAEAEEESRVQSEIIQKPDGSRVLMVTMEVNGVQTTTSVRISDPDDSDQDNPLESEEESAIELDVVGAAAQSAGTDNNK